MRPSNETLVAEGRLPRLGDAFTEGVSVDELATFAGSESSEDHVTERGYPTEEDLHQDRTVLYALGGVAAILSVIGVTAAKRLHDNRREY